MDGVLLWLLFAAAAIIPMLKLLPHFGVNKYWAVTCVMPIFIVILLWIMAMKLQELEKR